MNKKDTINFGVLFESHFQNDFPQVFCEMFLPRVQEFRTQFEEAIREQNLVVLKDIVHTFTASIRFLEMNDFAQLLQEYKTLDFANKTNVDAYLYEILEYCTVLESGIIELQQDF